MKSYIFPKKIVLRDRANCENLLKNQPLQIGLSETKTSLFEHGAFVVLDFGKEIQGRPSRQRNGLSRGARQEGRNGCKLQVPEGSFLLTIVSPVTSTVLGRT